MEIGQAVRVIAQKTEHRFALGEIVYRAPRTRVVQGVRQFGFMRSSGQVWFMAEDEYEIIDLPKKEDTLRQRILREEVVALIERFISKHEILQAAISAVAETDEEAEYLRTLDVSVELL